MRPGKRPLKLLQLEAGERRPVAALLPPGGLAAAVGPGAGAALVAAGVAAVAAAAAAARVAAVAAARQGVSGAADVDLGGLRAVRPGRWR